MSSELQNVPALWTAVFHWLACLVYLSLLPRRRSLSQCALAGTVLLAVMIPYMTLIAPLDGASFNLGMTGFAALTLLPFLFLCGGDVYHHLYYCARAFILGGFTVSLAWQLYSYYRQRAAWLKPLWTEAAFLLTLGCGVYAGMYFLERAHRREMQEMAPSRFSSLGAVLIAFIIYILSSLSYSSLESPFTTHIEAEAFNIRTIVYLGGVAILFAYHLQLCESFALQEVSALQNVLDMQYANYQQSQDSIDRVNRTYHDLKHQIAMLRAEIGAEQKLESLDQIERGIRSYEARSQTGNKVLDAILTQKSAWCIDHGITLTSVADGSALDFMSAVDLSALFGNLLDNAIEGVSRLPDPDQRLIHLTVSRQKGFLRIRVENRCVDGLTVDNELPRTTKEDRGRHGYGLKSIRATAEKYGGSMTLKAEKGWFVLGVLIPIPAGRG